MINQFIEILEVSFNLAIYPTTSNITLIIPFIKMLNQGNAINSMAGPYHVETDNDFSSFRKVDLDNKTKSIFCSNKVETARYSILTWIPKSIFTQFSRLNNFYFLILSILCFFPFSPKNPYSIAGIFIAVILFSMIKDGIEDIWRHKQDKQVNLRTYLKLNNSKSKTEKVHCQDLTVGDIVQIEEHQEIPADCILITSSNQNGSAYLNTMSLDGETSLKEKLKTQVLEHIKSIEEILSLKARFFVDKPNISLVNWNANIEFNSTFSPLNHKQLLLRGCVLKNTDWVLAVVVYTGADCKIILNSKPAQTKISELQKKMNKIVITILFLLGSFSLLFAGLGKSWHDGNDVDGYIDQPSEYRFKEFVVRALTYWIQLAALIPISLYVVIEIQRLILCSFIDNDLEMYVKDIDRAATWRCSDIIEQMGKVEFVFSDKTGTLTKNEMELVKININGKNFQLKSEIEEIQSLYSDPSSPMHSFFTLLSLCNTVFPSLHLGKPVLHSISPDDLALVSSCSLLSIEMLERTDNSITLKTSSNLETWKILAEIPFTSERKKLTIVSESPSGQVFLFTKGADMVILPMIKSPKNSSEVLTNFAREGLRTLVMAGKELQKAELEPWMAEYLKVVLSNSQDKDQELDRVATKIEKNLKLFGISAIEDKLQDGVAEAIDLLLKADMQVWMITGDKEETAEEIAKSCNMLNNSTELIQIFETNTEAVTSLIQSKFQKYSLEGKTYPELKLQKAQSPVSICINGVALSSVLSSPELSSKFFKLAFISQTCICSRMSPAQKSEIVKLCKSQGRWTTLAVGDGANDVSMIQEAHIGVGVAGKEGTQALLAAEYTLPRFPFLTRLLLVHGRYSYMRMSRFINYYFYKNFLMTFCEGWLAFYSGFSGQIYYLDWIPSFYNLFWTSWPSLAFFSLEQDVSPAESLKFPNLYTAGQKDAFFTTLIFWRWILLAFLSGTFIFWVTMAGLHGGVGDDGREPGLFWISTTSFVLLMHVTNLKLVVTSRFWNKVNV